MTYRISAGKKENSGTEVETEVELWLCFRILIEHGADVNVQDEEELTPLHCAAR